MKHEPDISPERRRRPTLEDVRRAKAAQVAGGGIEHVVVGEWLLTWGKPDRKDFPDWLAEQDG